MDLSTGGRRELRRQLEANPDWESDLLALYRFDIWDAIDGRVPVRQALQLINRLSFEPKSIWRAKYFGGSELKEYGKFYDWDATTYVMADVVDAVNANSAMIASVFGGEAPEIELYPRPGSAQAPERPKESLADFGNKLAGMFGPGNIGG